MTAYFLFLALIGLCAARQIRKWRDEDDMARVNEILEAWAREERRKHGRDGRYRRVYGVITFPHD